jgi:hypothetical protein
MNVDVLKRLYVGLFQEYGIQEKANTKITVCHGFRRS